MNIDTKIIVSIIVVVVIISMLLAILIKPTGGEESPLPTYVIEESETNPLDINKTLSEEHRVTNTNTTSQEVQSIFIEVIAYLRNFSGEVVVFINVYLRAGEDSFFYLVEVNINNYSRDHPLYSYTVKVFDPPKLIEARHYSIESIEFQIPLKQPFINEWRIGSEHKLYIKIRVPPDLRTIKTLEIPFIIAESSGYKQTVRLPI